MARFEKVASRYAKAIFDFQSKAKAKDFLEELEKFSQLLSENKDLQQMVSSDLFSGEKQKDVVKDLTTKLKMSEATQRTLQVIAEGKRLNALPLILDRLNVLMLEAADVFPLKVDTAVSLSVDQREKIENKFSKLLGRKVQANYNMDEKLIGGVRVTAGNRTFDGSLSGWLSAVQEELVAN